MSITAQVTSYLTSVSNYNEDTAQQGLDGFGPCDIADLDEVDIQRSSLIKRCFGDIDLTELVKNDHRFSSYLEESWLKEAQEEQKFNLQLKRELDKVVARRDGRTAFCSLMDYVNDCQDHHKVGDIAGYQKQFVKQFTDQVPIHKTTLDRSKLKYSNVKTITL